MTIPLQSLISDAPEMGAQKITSMRSPNKRALQSATGINTLALRFMRGGRRNFSPDRHGDGASAAVFDQGQDIPN
ncbi:MAG: hypothetical protein AAGL96_10060 [Pseudomonadota bacterium]